MYQPPHFVEDDLARKQDFVRAFPFGLLVTAGSAGLMANGIPWLLEAGAGSGVLRGHVARANGQWRACIGGTDALVVFQGPDHYITPSWYPTKQETHKVVPTWNYAMVQARGIARVNADPSWLHTQINELTDHQEAERAHPWAVNDAPEPYIQSQLRGIIGIEIPIDAIEGKWKVSQNRPEADRRGVVQGLEEVNPAMAVLVREFGKL